MNQPGAVNCDNLFLSADPDTYIAGASGGVYALIAAHLATLALNWREDSAVKIRKVIHKPLTR